MPLGFDAYLSQCGVNNGGVLVFQLAVFMLLCSLSLGINWGGGGSLSILCGTLIKFTAVSYPIARTYSSVLPCMFYMTIMDPSWCTYECLFRVGSMINVMNQWAQFCCTSLTARLDYHMPCGSHCGMITEERT